MDAQCGRVSADVGSSLPKALQLHQLASASIACGEGMRRGASAVFELVCL